jgi:hypothetical protein
VCVHIYASVWICNSFTLLLLIMFYYYKIILYLHPHFISPVQSTTLSFYSINTLLNPNNDEHVLYSVLLEDFYANSVAPMVIQIVYVNGATVRTGVEIEGSLVVRMLQYGDVVESFQRLKTKEGVLLNISIFSYFFIFLLHLSSLHLSASPSFSLFQHISADPTLFSPSFLPFLNFLLIHILFLHSLCLTLHSVV